MRQVNQPAIVENRHLDAALMLARQMQAIMPHHRKRNNDAPARRDQPTHLFPEHEVTPKIDRRRLGGAKLKSGPRLSDAELRERGTHKFVTRMRPDPLLLQRADRSHSLKLSTSAGAGQLCGEGITNPPLASRGGFHKRRRWLLMK